MQVNDSIHNFITENFSDRDLNRGILHGQLNNNNPFEEFFEYEDFYNDQRNITNNLDINTLSFLQQLQLLINSSNIELFFKENEENLLMDSVTCDGFIFLKDKLVLTMPQ